MPSTYHRPNTRAKRNVRTIKHALTMIIMIPCVTAYALIEDISPETAVARLDKWIDEITKTD